MLRNNASTRSIFRVALALAVVLVAPLDASAQATIDAKPDVMAVVRRLFDGMRAGDSAMVRSVFHPQLRMLSVGTAKEGASGSTSRRRPMAS